MSSPDQHSPTSNQAAPGSEVQSPPATPPPAPPPTAPPPSPSRSVAAWLVIAFLNIALFVFLLPDWIVEDKKVTLLTKVLPAVIAGGLFAAGLVWFKSVLVTLPERRWFKIANIIALSLLIPLTVSQQNVVGIQPQIERNGYTFKVFVDNEERSYEPGGKMRLSIANHTVRIVPETEDNQTFPQIKEGTCKVSYADMLHAVFCDYRPHWGPLYLILISVPEPNVEVLIHKTDEEGFNSAFVEHPPPTEKRNPFAAKLNSGREFVYRGSEKDATIDRLYLPYGEYEFTASRPDCRNNPQLQRKIGEDPRRYIITFDSLCPRQ